MNTILTVNNLTKSFFYFPIINSLDFCLHEGESVALIGNNGVGKSTLLRILAKVSTPEKGSIFFKGKNILKGKVQNRMGIYYCGHAPGLYPTLSAKDNVKLFCSFYGTKITDNQILSKLDEYDLKSVGYKQVKVFSQGMIQRLKLVHVELIDWSLLLIDEPFSGLDMSGQEFVRNRFNSWKSTGKTILFVDHDLERVFDLCSRVILLKEGRIQIDETVNDKPELFQQVKRMLN